MIKREYVPLAAIGLIFGVLFFWSIWSETIRPLIVAGDTTGLLLHLVGMPIILVGLAVFVYGGYRCVRNTFDLLKNETFLQQAAVIREQQSPASVRTAQWVHLRLWASALGRGGLWMLLGFLCFGIGGYLINR